MTLSHCREAKKGAWGMPRLFETKKDVISCEKLRGLAHTKRSADILTGQPARECAQECERTRRTETSKYPQEKKTIVIS